MRTYLIYLTAFAFVVITAMKAIWPDDFRPLGRAIWLMLFLGLLVLGITRKSK